VSSDVSAEKMKYRIKADELPETVLEPLGAIANKGQLRVQDVEYRPQEQLVTFPFHRFPIVGKSTFSGVRHAKRSVPCRATIRNVSACEIEDTQQCKEITIIFGIGFRGKEVFFSSAEESSGTTCYTLSCTVSAIDIEMHDE
jgi:hypothetical protein